MKRIIWFSRAVLMLTAVIMTAIALRNLRDPVGATRPLDIVLASPTATTIVRVGFGGFPLGFAIALFACLLSNARLLTGLVLVVAVVGAATAARIQGLLLDGVTPYNLSLLRPEFLMLALATAGILLHRRHHHEGERS